MNDQNERRGEVRGDSLLGFGLNFQGSVERYVRGFLERKYGDPDAVYRPEVDHNDLLAYMAGVADEALRLGTTDQLTGAGNRRALDQVFDYEKARSLRAGTEEYHGIAMVDITMKPVNDHPKFGGHQAGDTFLQLVTDLMKRSAGRGADRVFRTGGDEFVAYLPGTDYAGTIIVADKIRKGLIQISDEHFEGIASGGVGTYSFLMQDGTSLDEAVKKADEALYAARRTAKQRRTETEAAREEPLVFLNTDDDLREIVKVEKRK